MFCFFCAVEGGTPLKLYRRGAMILRRGLRITALTALTEEAYKEEAGAHIPSSDG